MASKPSTFEKPGKPLTLLDADGKIITGD